MVVVDGQHPDLPRPEAEDARSARERRVSLIREVRDEIGSHCAGERLARARECRGIRRGAAAHEHAACTLRQAEPFPEPAQNLELDLRRPRRLHPGTRIDVRGARDEVAHSARPRAAAGDEGEEGWVVDAAREREHIARDSGEDVLERPPLVRRRPRQPRTHFLRRGAPEWGSVSVAQPVDEHVDRAVAKLTHGRWIQPKRLSGRHRAAIVSFAGRYLQGPNASRSAARSWRSSSSSS